MVLTAAQITVFFESPAGMAIPHETRMQLQEEGIDDVSDLADFDKDTLKQVADNLRRPGGRVPNPDPGAVAGAMIPTPPFVFGAKSQMRLLAACDLIRYYDTVGREITTNNIRWDPVIKNFSEQWRALTNRRQADAPEVPKISKTLSVIKWTEAFADFLYRSIGVRTIPLAYVTRREPLVPAAAPPLAANRPHSAEHGSVDGELVARASHDHPLYRDDNSQVYYYLEEATRTTSYAASIKPYQRAKNGRGAWLALKAQYAGNDKWQAEIKVKDDLLHTRVWKGQSNFSLEKFIAQHRNAYVSMQQCAEHVAFQLPNEHTRVTYLLDGIQCNDAPLQAAMALVRNDTDPDGKMNDFEATASYLLPHDPVSKKRIAGTKRGVAEISDTSGIEASSSTAGKLARGQTGVEFRFHERAEYSQLSSEQKEELREHRLNRGTKKSDKGNKKSQGNPKWDKSMKKLIAAAVNKKYEKKLQDEQSGVEDDAKIRSYIMSLMSGDGTSSAATQPPTKASASTATATKPPMLNSILKRAKNMGG
jgi:hypothetical protein